MHSLSTDAYHLVCLFYPRLASVILPSKSDHLIMGEIRKGAMLGHIPCVPGREKMAFIVESDGRQGGTSSS